MEYVIGVDGGGTKTHCLMADENGVIIASCVGGPSNPNVMKATALRKTLEMLLARLREQANAQFHQVTHLFAGISGAGNENNQREIKRILTELVPSNVIVEVYPDSINALYSGTIGEPGIVQISGTGSITYGINQKLEHDRVGGWGYLFGDEGSGFDIGKQGIIAVLKAFDGRGEETSLQDLLYNHFDVKSPDELIRKIYASDSPKLKIAPVSKQVFTAYNQQDNIAINIIKNVVDELTSSIYTLDQKLFNNDKKQVPLVLCGGVFTDENILPLLIKQKLEEDNFTIVIPEFPPAGGSIIGAYLSKKKRIDKHMIENIKEMSR